MCLSHVEQVANIMQALATVAALGLGGAWSIWLFMKRRERYPRASIEHLVTHKAIGDGKVLLHVDVRVSNIGEVLMSLVCLETRIQQVLPVPPDVADKIRQGLDPVPEGETEVEWPLLKSHSPELEMGDCEIEPGESQDINHDFILDADVETVQIYSYVMNEKKRERTLAWDLTTLHDLAGGH